jgi:hypothetical protein
LLVLLTPMRGAAEVVDDVVAFAAKHGGGPLAVRTLAIVSLAMFDAANAVERRYQPYIASPPAPADIDIEQAALAAGCAALATIRPAQADAIHRECLAIRDDPLTEGSARSRRYGEPIGVAHAETRRNDGIGAANAYRPYTAPGVYVPTLLPVGFDVATAMPFALTSPSQFRPDAPPALASERWSRDYNEVRTMGARDGSQRTAEQTATALFFASNGPQQFLDSVTPLPPGLKGTTDRARYYALVYMALFDTGVALFDAKYSYNFWRPITAIRNGDLDGNDATPRDAGWMPLIETPPHPEYPCAHCVTAAAFAAVMLAGERKLLVVRSAALPGQAASTREFRSTHELAALVADARVFAGLHYRASTEAGERMGTAIGEYVVATQLRRLAR